MVLEYRSSIFTFGTHEDEFQPGANLTPGEYFNNFGTSFQSFDPNFLSAHQTSSFFSIFKEQTREDFLSPPLLPNPNPSSIC